MEFPTYFKTEKFKLRPLNLSDQGDLYRLDSDPVVMEYFPSVRNRPESFEYLLKCLQYSNENPGLGKFVIESNQSEDFVGLAILQHLGDTVEIEVGYRLHRRYWGRGVATRATQILLRYAFEELGLPRVVGIAHPDNLASLRVLEKVGMEFRGMARHYDIEVKLHHLEREKWQNLFG